MLLWVKRAIAAEVRLSASVCLSWLHFPAMAAMEIDSRAKIPRKQASYRSLVRSPIFFRPSLQFPHPHPPLSAVQAMFWLRLGRETHSWYRNLPLSSFHLLPSQIFFSISCSSIRFRQFSFWFLLPMDDACRMSRSRYRKRPTEVNNTVKYTSRVSTWWGLSCTPSYQPGNLTFPVRCLASFILSSAACCSFVICEFFIYSWHLGPSGVLSLVTSCIFRTLWSTLLRIRN